MKKSIWYFEFFYGVVTLIILLVVGSLVSPRLPPAYFCRKAVMRFGLKGGAAVVTILRPWNLYLKVGGTFTL